MTRNKFKSSIKRGTGEAILILRKNPNLDVTDLIINASINNLAYDPQCEGDRGFYLYELIKLSANREKIEIELLKKLSESVEDLYGDSQLFEIAKFMALDGNRKAKSIIYKRYLSFEDESIDSRAIIAIDDFYGLKFIAVTEGKRLLNNHNYSIFSHYILEYAKEFHPEIDFKKKLKLESKNNKFIDAFLKEIQREKNQWKQSSLIKNKEDYNSIMEKIEKKEKRPSFLGRLAKRYLSFEDSIKLANNLEKESDKNRIIKYLWIFSEIKYPLKIDNLFKFLDFKNQRIRGNVTQSLKFFKDDRIRKFALNKLNSKKFDTEHLELLVENYEDNDDKIICKIIKNIKNESKLDSFGIRVLDIYEKNETKKCLEPLKAIYDKTSCSICRSAVIELMIKNKVLPDKIKEEIEYDSYEDTRKIFKKKYKKINKIKRDKNAKKI